MEHFRFDVVDPTGADTGEDDFELLPFLEESGLTDAIGEMLGDEAKELFENGLATYRQRHERPTDARLRNLPPLRRAIAELQANPFWDIDEPVGLIGSDGDEVAWRLQRGHLMGRTPDGAVVHFSVHYSGREGDAVDTMINIYDRSTMSSMGVFLTSADSSWIGRSGSFAIERPGSDSAPRLSMFLRRTRPPGGWIPFYLGPEEADRFADIVKELVDGKWGELIAPVADGRFRTTVHSIRRSLGVIFAECPTTSTYNSASTIRPMTINLAPANAAR